MVSQTRKRTLSVCAGSGVVGVRLGDIISLDYTIPYKIVAKQVTTSSDNPIWMLVQRQKRLPGYRNLPKAKRILENRDSGSNFTTEKQVHWNSHPRVYVFDLNAFGAVQRTYTGPVFAFKSTNTGATSGFPTLTPRSELEILARGTKFIAETIPTNPVAGVAQFIGELREGLPQIPGRAFWQSQNRTALGALRQSGSEYVNAQFALIPFAKDLVDFADTVNKSEKIISQYTRDSGRNIYRRRALPVETTTEITTIGPSPLSPGLPGQLFSVTSGTVTRTRVTKTKWTFSACYTYYLDPGKTALGRLNRQVQIANKLLGVRITPELIWELTPWSWAADYVGNIGNVMTNVSALMSDGLVIRWAYVMCEQHVTDTYVNTGPVFKNGGPSGPFVQVFSSVRKVRRKATPYGFGLNPDAFTPRQWAVLGALGISKGPRQL